MVTAYAGLMTPHHLFPLFPWQQTVQLAMARVEGRMVGKKKMNQYEPLFFPEVPEEFEQQAEPCQSGG